MVLSNIIGYIILTVLSLIIAVSLHESGHYILAKYYGYNPSFGRGTVGIGEYRHRYIGVKLNLTEEEIKNDIRKFPDRHMMLSYAGIFPGLIGILPLIIYGNAVLIAIFLMIYFQGCSLDVLQIIILKDIKKYKKTNK